MRKKMANGTEGQDRKSYSDTQDRESYTVSSERKRTIVKMSRDQQLVALMCPYKDCGQTFSLKQKGNAGSYDMAKWDKHLIEVHKFIRPKLVEVWGF